VWAVERCMLSSVGLGNVIRVVAGEGLLLSAKLQTDAFLFPLFHEAS
jgi:hypothetical protein